MSDSLRPYGLYPTRLLHPWDSPGKSTGVSCHCLLQETFPTQRSNLGLPHCRQMLYPLSHQRSPKKATSFPCSSVSKESACSAGDLGSISGLGRSPGEGNGNPLQYTYLENLLDRGVWWAAVQGFEKSQTRLSN